MGRLVFAPRERSMFQVIICYCLLFVTISLPYTTAADLDIYPELADEAILKRIQHLLTEWRQKQLHIQLQESEILPQFTYHFPEERNQNYQSDYFAVPPSDPRYYQQQPGSDAENKIEKSNEEDKRDESDTLSGSATEVPANKGAQIEPVKTRQESLAEDDTSESPSGQHVEDSSIFIKKIFDNDSKDLILYAVMAGCGFAGAVGVVALFIGWYRLHINSKAAADIEYPAYGVTGPNKEISPTGDRRLAQSAQMYHYQHQKQQIIAMENNRANNERRGSVSEGDSDEENEEGDYTVYECPGLAATGELEVKNPLFLDDPTPAATGNKTCEEPPAPSDKKQ